jgi:hypothetical protein
VVDAVTDADVARNGALAFRVASLGLNCRGNDRLAFGVPPKPTGTAARGARFRLHAQPPAAADHERR